MSLRSDDYCDYVFDLVTDYTSVCVFLCLLLLILITNTKVFLNKQILTIRVILQGETNPVSGDTAVNVINLNWRLGLLLQTLTILPDILIWYRKKDVLVQMQCLVCGYIIHLINACVQIQCVIRKIKAWESFPEIQGQDGRLN